MSCNCDKSKLIENMKAEHEELVEAYKLQEREIKELRAENERLKKLVEAYKPKFTKERVFCKYQDWDMDGCECRNSSVLNWYCDYRLNPKNCPCFEKEEI